MFTPKRSLMWMLFMALIAGGMIWGEEMGLKTSVRSFFDSKEAGVAVEMMSGALGLNEPVSRWDRRSREKFEAGGERMQELLLSRDSTLVRWKWHETLKIWMEPPSKSPSWDPKSPEIMWEALEHWVGLGLPVKLERAAGPEDANVLITWVETLGDDRVGSTEVDFNEVLGITRAVIVIAMQDEFNRSLSRDRLKKVSIHEVGHALGLTHTSDISSIMSPRGGKGDITKEDLNHVHLLYNLPMGHISRAGQ